MCFVENHVVPRFSLEDMRIPTGESIGGDADIEVVLVVPPLPKLLPPLGRTMIAQSLKTRQEFLEFHLPIQKNASWNNLRT